MTIKKKILSKRTTPVTQPPSDKSIYSEKQAAHISTEEENGSKKHTYDFEDYLNIKTLQFHPSNTAHKLRLAAKLIQWADSLTRPYPLYSFWASEGIGRKTIHEWTQKCPELLSAIEYAKSRLADIHYNGAMEKRYSEGLVKWALPLYMKEDTDKLHEEDLARRIKIAESGRPEGGSNNFTIEMSPVPNSDIVPPRTDDEL